MPHLPRFKHFLITRYLVRFSEDVSDIRIMIQQNPGWLEERFEIFRNFCFPSVRAQSNQNFTWLLYFDENIPEKYIDEVRALVTAHGNIKIVLCRLFDDQTRRETILADLSQDIDWLLTTRLDNDDGLHREFIDTIQSQVRFSDRECLNYPVGLILYSGKTFLYRHSSNAFISMIEPVTDFKTVYCDQHVRLGHIAPIRQLPAFPAFMQVVHGGTRSNKPRGVRVHRMLGLVGFEAMIGVPDGADEDDWEIVRYNASIAASWALRDRLTHLGRRLLNSLRRG